MGKTYYTYSATAKHPYKVRFKCPVCGAENRFNHVFETHAGETFRHIPRDIDVQRLEYEAQSKAYSRAAELIKELGEGNVIELTNPTGNPSTFPIKCEKCGTVQVPSCYKGERRLGVRQGCLAKFVLWIVLTIVYIVSIILMRSGTAFLLLTLAFVVLTTLLVVLHSRKEKKMNQLAETDPEKMKDIFHAAFNETMEADFTEYGLGLIHVGADAKKIGSAG